MHPNQNNSLSFIHPLLLEMAILYPFVYAFLALLGSLATPLHCLAHNDHNKHVALFVFGDSIFDPGNNNYINTITDAQANFPPYGETFFKNPTGRWCDGRTVPDFIAEFAKLPLIPAYFETQQRGIVNGVNFASGGSGCLAETFPGLVIDLHTQVQYFKNVTKQLKGKLGDKESNQLLSDAVYMFSTGNNDYFSVFSPLSNNSAFFNSFTHDQYVNLVIGNFTTAIKEIYKEGGRKFVVFSTVPLGCVPSTRVLNLQLTNTSGCFKELQELANMHNKALLQELINLEKTLQGFKYTYFDFYSAITDVIAHPSRYGVKNATTACCGSGPWRGLPSCGGKRSQLTEYELCEDPGDYLFFDHGHPTEKCNRQFATSLWNGVPKVVRPYSVKSLFE
nr:GDSL esterase/lipase 1-like [Ipomoea batatas]